MIIAIFDKLGPLQSVILGNVLIYLLSELSDIEKKKSELINVAIVWIFSSCMPVRSSNRGVPDIIRNCWGVLNLFSWMIILCPIETNRLSTRIFVFTTNQIFLIGLFLIARPI